MLNISSRPQINIKAINAKTTLLHISLLVIFHIRISEKNIGQTLKTGRIHYNKQILCE